MSARPSRDCPHGEPLGWAHCPVCRAEEGGQESLAQLRAGQVVRAMPLVGPLLDAWDQLPKDLATDPCMDHLEDCVDALRSAMEDDEPATPAALERAVREALPCNGEHRTMYGSLLPQGCAAGHHGPRCFAFYAPRVLAALARVDLEAVVEAARLRSALEEIFNLSPPDEGEDSGDAACIADAALAAPPSAGVAELRELVAALAPAFGKVGYHLDHMDRVRSAHAALLAALPALKEAP